MSACNRGGKKEIHDKPGSSLHQLSPDHRYYLCSRLLQCTVCGAAVQGGLKTASGAEFSSQIADQGKIVEVYETNHGITALTTN